MSEKPQHILYLVVDSLPEARKPQAAPDENVEIFVLTEASAAEALKKIFAADSVSVWGEVR